MTGNKFPFSHKVHADRLGDREETIVIEPDKAALKRAVTTQAKSRSAPMEDPLADW